MSKQARRRKRQLNRERSVYHYFDQWLLENPNALPIKVKRLSIHDKVCARYSLEGYPQKIIAIHTTSWDFSVVVQWRTHKERRSDMLISLDGGYVPKGEGVVCTFCQHEKGDDAPIFPDRMSLYKDHFFEPLAEWMKDDLLPSTHLALNTDKGIWVAALVQPEQMNKHAGSWLWRLDHGTADESRA